MLKYSEVGGGGSVDDSTLGSKVSDGIIDSERDFVAILVVTAVSIVMIWDSPVVTDSITFEDVVI